MFVDLSKAFDTVDHQILLKTLGYYAIAGNIQVYHSFPSYKTMITPWNNLRWSENYLKNQKQFYFF